MPVPFTPPRLLRNPHVQTVLASLAPRKLVAGRRAARLRRDSQQHILDCGDGVRLLGAMSSNQANTKGQVTLIHGWEGSIDSAYLLSAASALYDAGFNVFRLNLRDHGHSHHLNRQLFNSTRLEEVVQAIAAVHDRFPHPCHFLAGFSLGGNFALRVALRAPEASLQLTATAAISPLIDPVAATEALEEQHPLYHRYFVDKWKRSLQKKFRLFPDLDSEQTLLGLRTLTQMHDYFVPRHTDHPTTRAYLSAYAISSTMLSTLTTPTHIIHASDDPITPFIHPNIPSLSPVLQVDQVQYGGHCGFLEDYRLNSWADRRLIEIFTQYPVN